MNNAHRLSKYGFKPSTFVDLLRWRALHQPDRQAYTFLVDGESDEVHITYEELDCKARAIAALLQSFASPGEGVLLLYPPGIDYIAGFFGCLYAGVIAVPAYPPDPVRLDRTLPRLQVMLADVQATVVLTTSPILALAEFLFDQAPDLGALQWMATDTVASGVEYGWQEPKLSLDSLAFLQYTSGSTRSPKGVIVSHGNLLHNSALISAAFNIQESDLGMIWLPPYHDMGLIGGILQPLYKGLPVILMSPLDFLQKPFRWLKAISHYRANVSGGPNFAYDICARKVTPDQKVTLDLSCWQVAFSGAEPVRAETLENFVKAFKPCGFRSEAFLPCYGLAEATLIVSGGKSARAPVIKTLDGLSLEKDRVVLVSSDAENARPYVSCGKSLADQMIVIADPELLTKCSPDQVGEIWVSGLSVAQGYWNLPDDTDRTFHAYLKDTGEGPFLRTGDLGFIMDDELFVTGRLKDLIIIDGYNHYPQDIEQTIDSCHPAIRPGCSAAFSVVVDNQERLVAIAEVVGNQKQELNQPESRRENNSNQVDLLSSIVQDIRKSISAKHDLRVHEVVLVKPRSIPKTSSGKIQRHACQADYLRGTLDVVYNGSDYRSRN